MQAYILIQTEIGRSAKVARETSALPGVESSEVLTGGYDVITKVTAADVDELGRLVAEGIQAVEGITRTVTCPVIHL